MAPEVFRSFKKSDKIVCANVDFYSGFVYNMLGIPPELYTPIFAVARIAGWSAHRIEELVSGGRIMRPAYKCVQKRRKYVGINNRKATE
jgi:citrate synthase